MDMFSVFVGICIGIAIHAPVYIKYIKPRLVARGILREREPDSSASST